MKNRNIYMATAFLIAALGIGVSSLAFAYFFSAPQAQTATLQTGTVRVELHENFPTTDEYGAPLSTVKEFSCENTGNKMAYVRVQIFPCPEYHYVGLDASGAPVDEWRPLTLPTSAFTITITAPDWIDGSDGYLYYDKILNPTDSTTEVTVTLAINNPAALPAGLDIRLNLRVSMEAAQTTNDAYKVVFDIPTLPNGVETLDD